MNIAIAYGSCALAAIVILLQCRTVRHLIRSATWLRAVFPSPPASTVEATAQGFPRPLALALGSPIPNFRANRIDGTTGSVDRTSLVGETSMVVFCRARQLEEWEPDAIVTILGGCWTKVDGKVHVFLPTGERLDMTNDTVRALQDSVFAPDLVFAEDESGALWKAFDVRVTPCVIQLDQKGVLRKYGVIRQPDKSRTNGGSG